MGFYGGLLVMTDGHGHITSGELVSFLLYLSSLTDAFNSIGYIFASLTQAVGAADKVFELIHRKPKRTEPSSSPSSMTLNVPPGAVAALVGPSGGGKSSIVS